MCAFIDADDNEGADMVDAIVWAITELGGLGFDTYHGAINVVGDPRLRSWVVK
jgi:hypothetical protein